MVQMCSLGLAAAGTHMSWDVILFVRLGGARIIQLAQRLAARALHCGTSTGAEEERGASCRATQHEGRVCNGERKMPPSRGGKEGGAPRRRGSGARLRSQPLYGAPQHGRTHPLFGWPRGTSVAVMDISDRTAKDRGPRFQTLDKDDARRNREVRGCRERVERSGPSLLLSRSLLTPLTHPSWLPGALHPLRGARRRPQSHCAKINAHSSCRRSASV